MFIDWHWTIKINVIVAVRNMYVCLIELKNILNSNFAMAKFQFFPFSGTCLFQKFPQPPLDGACACNRWFKKCFSVVVFVVVYLPDWIRWQIERPSPPPQNASKLFVWSGMAMSDDDDDVIPTQSKQKPAFLRQQFLCNENVVFVHIRWQYFKTCFLDKKIG